MAGTIVFNSIYVNVQDTNSAIFIGENSAAGWDSHNKNQMSIGSIMNAFASATLTSGNLNILYDNDLLDTMIADPDREGGPTVQV